MKKHNKQGLNRPNKLKGDVIMKKELFEKLMSAGTAGCTHTPNIASELEWNGTIGIRRQANPARPMLAPIKEKQ